jgi:excisionase family DNA binding protein
MTPPADSSLLAGSFRLDFDSPACPTTTTPRELTTHPNLSFLLWYTLSDFDRFLTTLVDVMTDRWLSVEEVSQHLGVTKDTLYRWISRRGLPAYRVGRLWKLRLEEVDHWVANEAHSTERETTVHAASHDRHVEHA